jgi:CRP-like cAMP-binding protein
VRLQVRLTHQDLANAIGTTRVTITRLLNRFRQQGWVAVDKNRHLVIKLAHAP